MSVPEWITAENPDPVAPSARTAIPEGYSAGSWRRSPAWTTCVPLDHLRSVGPLAFRWTTVFREPGGPTAFKWSNRTQVVQADRPRHDMRDAVPPCGTRRRGGAGAGGAGTAPLHPVRPRRPDRRSRRAERPASVARYGGDPLRGPALRRGTRPRKGGRRVLHRPGSTAVRRGRAFLTGRDGPWVRRRCGGGDGRARGGADGAPGTILGGACPNLLQRRPATGSAENKSPKYQRFSSGAPARSGPLQQIWTTDPPVD